MARHKRSPKSSRDLKRRPAFRSIPDRILIVTEGSKTEPSYFWMLISELGLTTAKVTIVGDGGSAPINVAEEAIKILEQDDDFEQIYCVFDRDRHASYAQALNLVREMSESKKFKKKTILSITSVPCFEIWYLLHVSGSRKPYESASTGGSPAQILISDLRKNEIFADYLKNGCDSFFHEIADKREEAVNRATRFLQAANEEGAEEFHENPSTRVHLLVRALTEISNKKNQ